MSDNFHEELAAYAHNAWSGWMKYMFSKFENVTRWSGDTGTDTDPVTVQIPAALYDRWIYQMNTPYNELPEDMKPSDRDEADKIVAVMKESHIFDIVEDHDNDN